MTIRRTLGWTPLLVIAALAGCGGRSVPGVVRMALSVPLTTLTVSSVQWRVISAAHDVVVSGSVDTSGPSVMFSVETSCPAGSGYEIALTATASDGSTCSGISAPFDMMSGGTVMVSVTLTCGGGVPMQGNGSVAINGTLVAGDNCPVMNQWQASPIETTSGDQIDAFAQATDADPADVLSYLWLATSGSFSNPGAAITTYTCSPAGPATLTVIVSDGHLPVPCTAAESIPVYCFPVGVCGDGIVEPGEQCDPPNGSSCSATCQLTMCGDGVVEAGEECDPPNSITCSTSCQHIPKCGNYVIEPGEQCDPPGFLGCNSSCQLPLGKCGDGLVQPGEQCDPPNGTTCHANCQLARCGDGILDPGEQCDPPDGITCGANCQTIPNCVGAYSACDLCEQAESAQCPASLEVVPGVSCAWGCNGFPAGSTARTDCQALTTCILRSNCMVNDDPTACLCGTLTAGNCLSLGAPATAPCAGEYALAASHASTTVFQQFTDTTSPVGIANNIAACDVDSACACR